MTAVLLEEFLIDVVYICASFDWLCIFLQYWIDIIDITRVFLNKTSLMNLLIIYIYPGFY